MEKTTAPHKHSVSAIRARFVAISWRDLAVSFGPMVLLIIVGVWLAIWLIHPAPPKTITIATGPEHSNFWNVAERYKKILARDGVTVKIVASEGSLDNLHKLVDSASGVDVAFVQGGVAACRVARQEYRHRIAGQRLARAGADLAQGQRHRTGWRNEVARHGR